MRRAAARLAGLLVVLVGLVALTGVSGTPVAHAQTSSRAVVIVSTGSGVHTTVIEFSGTVNGLEALQLAGASPETISYGAMGQAVCKLYGVGDAPVPGSCPGGWVYYRAVGGANGWSQSSLGASGTTVHDGDVEGWGYGGAPPFSSFCAVAGCAPPPTSPPAATTPPVEAPGAGGDNPTAVAGVTATTTPGGPTATSVPVADPGASAGTTTTTGAAGTSGARRLGRTVSAGGPVTATGGGGSPVGVIVAVVIVALLAGGGVVLRRRRQSA